MEKQQTLKQIVEEIYIHISCYVLTIYRRNTYKAELKSMTYKERTCSTYLTGQSILTAYSNY